MRKRDAWEGVVTGPGGSGGTPRRRPAAGGRSTAPSSPVKDLGRRGGAPRAELRRFLHPETARVFETIETAAVKAEEAVELFLRATALPKVRGRAAVGLRFLDLPTQVAFLRCGALTGKLAFGSRLLARRWADAGGDAHLDEHMAYVVARHLDGEFAGLLRATVFSYQERTD